VYFRNLDQYVENTMRRVLADNGKTQPEIDAAVTANLATAQAYVNGQLPARGFNEAQITGDYVEAMHLVETDLVTWINVNIP
jgi:hypothetical protein